MKNKLIRTSKGIRLVLDVVDSPVASGTNEYVPCTRYLICDNRGKTEMIYPYEVGFVISDALLRGEDRDLYYALDEFRKSYNPEDFPKPSR